MPLVNRVARPRYSALLIGTRQYQSAKWNEIAAGITAEVELAFGIFRRRLEYDECPVVYATGYSSLRDAVTGWADRQDQSVQDVNVLVWSNHSNVRFL